MIFPIVAVILGVFITIIGLFIDPKEKKNKKWLFAIIPAITISGVIAVTKLVRDDRKLREKESRELTKSEKDSLRNVYRDSLLNNYFSSQLNSYAEINAMLNEQRRLVESTAEDLDLINIATDTLHKNLSKLKDRVNDLKEPLSLFKLKMDFVVQLNSKPYNSFILTYDSIITDYGEISFSNGNPFDHYIIDKKFKNFEKIMTYLEAWNIFFDNLEFFVPLQNRDNQGIYLFKLYDAVVRSEYEGWTIEFHAEVEIDVMNNGFIKTISDLGNGTFEIEPIAPVDADLELQDRFGLNSSVNYPVTFSNLHIRSAKKQKYQVNLTKFSIFEGPREIFTSRDIFRGSSKYVLNTPKEIIN